MAMKKIWLEIKRVSDIHRLTFNSTFEVSSLHSLKVKDLGDEGKMKEKRQSHSKIKSLKSLKTLKTLSKLGCFRILFQTKLEVYPLINEGFSKIRQKPYSPPSKESQAVQGLGRVAGSGSGASPRGRGRPPHSGRGRRRGRSSSGRSNLSSIVNPDATSTPFLFTDEFSGFVDEFIQNWKNIFGDGNCGSRVVANFLFGDENQCPEIRRRMSYDLHHHMNMYMSLQMREGCLRPPMQVQWQYHQDPRMTMREEPHHIIIGASTGRNSRSNRVCGNALLVPKLFNNPVRHVWLDNIKVCNELVPCGYPTIPNLRQPVRRPSNLLC
ncbi:hypothetical protein M9H77_21340 [Catharanthus roseus]|uniref:Uncharacterized protein n=1 Tax=Catharanthus roseus TaxID=4058 RepID=A0ACC0ANJ5_CATRO|nr:hypothetical protein M9H77_21340 [Catharanthus roseus]